MFMNMKRAKLIAAGMAICFLFIHILMIAIFVQCGVTPMVRFNVFSIAFYIFTLFVVYKEWLPFYAVSVYLEVVAHMTLAVLLTGWKAGFQITLIGMNVLAFYAEYTGRTLKLKYIKVMPMCIVGMALYLGSYIYQFYHPAPYSLEGQAEFWLSILWGVIVFVINLFVLQLLVFIANSSEEQLEYQLSHDKLTGAPNRYYISTQFEKIQKKKEDYWLAIADIDGFKKINDTYGHNCGDYVLMTLGKLFLSKDVLCCRWGGEEFIFLGKRDGKYDPVEFLDGLRKEIEQIPFEFEGNMFSVTMTFGMSLFSSDEDIDKVISGADEKLYYGKHSGKNRVVTVIEDSSGSNLSYQDPLTKVKNVSAYGKMVESLNWDIQKKTAQFGIVKVKLRHLSDINERYGTEKGNDYITGACRILCGIFVNSQVFRIEGNEFVAIITNRDYYDREQLFEALNEKYKEETLNVDNSPWNQYMTSCKMAIYTSEDQNYDSVFERV
ncbi:GGDEF domain-containing protein [Butyrivibrio proteoclasticus]|uniref:GGDEF domain-containing protein n=1 Tax=Butyrivibrio proteoclasticus TaxID=43305 RepID=UPI0006882ADF|nr:diguanylate cyclase [Butyrivibrio proteoclasticus]